MDKLSLTQTIRNMQELGYSYYEIDMYCKEFHGKQYYKSLKTQTLLIQHYIDLWCTKELLPYILPDYNYQNYEM